MEERLGEVACFATRNGTGKSMKNEVELDKLVVVKWNHGFEA